MNSATQNTLDRNLASFENKQPDILATLFFVFGFIHIYGALRRRARTGRSFPQRLANGLRQRLFAIVKAAIFT